MVAPALVDGRPLSHPDFEPIWRAFVEHGVRPVFHVADQRRVFADGWYTDPPDSFVPTLDSVFLWTAAALACTDLILNGTLERHPICASHCRAQRGLGADVPDDARRRIGVHGAPERATLAPLALRPSEYFHRQVRVSSFAYEAPARLIRQTGDLYMCCSDYPHSEGTATPIADYATGRSRSAPTTPGNVPRQRGLTADRELLN